MAWHVAMIAVEKDVSLNVETLLVDMGFVRPVLTGQVDGDTATSPTGSTIAYVAVGDWSLFVNTPEYFGIGAVGDGQRPDGPMEHLFAPNVERAMLHLSLETRVHEFVIEGGAGAFGYGLLNGGRTEAAWFSMGREVVRHGRVPRVLSDLRGDVSREGVMLDLVSAVCPPFNDILFNSTFARYEYEAFVYGEW
jgi:hypothetical protein